MKKFYIALTVALIGFAFNAYALTSSDFGWKPVVNTKGQTVGLSNIGEKGGLLNVVCDVPSHKLNISYVLGGKTYDMFVFRKFGVIDMTNSGNEGKFIVGGNSTSQGDVYYNILGADKAFSINRFPVGSKAKWDKAVADNSVNGPDIEQEGDENFLTGEGWKLALQAVAVECPVKPDDKTPIF